VGLLSCLIDTQQWIKPRLEDFPEPLPGYVVSFVAFHKHGFSVPARRFIRAVLWTFGLELQHLNLNGVQHLVAFEAVCEGYLGVEVHRHLFRYFFGFVCLKDEGRPATIGCAALRLKWNRSPEYLVGPLNSTKSGWHKKWFYLKNDSKCPLSAYTGDYYDTTPDARSEGPPKKDHQKLLSRCLEELKALQRHGVDLAAVIGGYLTRGIVPLRRCPSLVRDDHRPGHVHGDRDRRSPALSG
jgi:hypothetical protein